jgi:hypothetical protein
VAKCVELFYDFIEKKNRFLGEFDTMLNKSRQKSLGLVILLYVFGKRFVETTVYKGINARAPGG